MEDIGEVIDELVEESDDRMADTDAVVGTVCDRYQMDDGRVTTLLRKMQHTEGVVTEPQQGYVRYLGWS